MILGIWQGVNIFVFSNGLVVILKSSDSITLPPGFIMTTIGVLSCHQWSTKIGPPYHLQQFFLLWVFPRTMYGCHDGPPVSFMVL